ncbi:MAG: MFS transporter [Dysgonamonadaceae bacterium]|jgi:MFS family permease|nr:MFS transporter [Dysgonamonadaceae bacterium]
MTIKESKLKRWTALALVSFTMLAAYMMTDLLSPLMDLLRETKGWNADEFGWYMSAYGWFNVFLGMLLIGGIILDKKGIRFTGLTSASLMVIGSVIQYYAVSETFDSNQLIWGYKIQVFYGALGYALFAVGAETTGITISKVLVKWFKGKELALAMGVQVGVARIGTFFALVIPLPFAKYFNPPSISAPLLFGTILILIGLLTFFIYTFMDKKLEKEENGIEQEQEEGFRLSDLVFIVKNKGFWLIAILCLLFYSCVFPFLKFATSFMIHKFHVPEELAGDIPGMLPFGTLLLTPIFGSIYDKKGKGATIMIIGAMLLVLVHLLFSIPSLDNWIIAVVLMIILGIAFSLVPSAMWPSLAKIIPEKQLGSAYAMTFFIQNIGLAGVPLLIGKVLQNYCIVSQTGEKITYNYTLPETLFTGIALLSLLVAIALKVVSKKAGYGLEDPNMQ